MNIFSHFYCRCYQALLRLGMKFIKIREPKLIEGFEAVDDIYKILLSNKKKHPLLIASKSVYNSHLLDKMIENFISNDIEYTLFKDVLANPPISLIEEVYSLFKENNCDSLIAIGGGSPMDTAKAVGARIANPKKNLEKMKGVLKVRHHLPFFIATPTTAGSGSEATLAAVITNSLTRDKFAIEDPCLVPDVALLDNKLILDLPKRITATTGMDALTHSVEAYIGKSGTRFTNKCALEAIKLIFANLEKTYFEPHNALARSNMLKASYLAGLSFSRAYVGYVHALAHSIGGYYNVEHGYANAVILPYVLKAYGKSIYKKVSNIVDYIEPNNNFVSKEEKTNYFINKIIVMNNHLEISNDNLKDVIKEEDIDKLVKHAYKEANPLYPVPKLFTKKDLVKVLLEIKNS